MKIAAVILLLANVLFGAEVVTRLNRVDSVSEKIGHGESQFAHSLGITGEGDRGSVEVALNSYYSTDNTTHFLTICQSLALEAIRNPAMGLEIRKEEAGACHNSTCQCIRFRRK